MESFEALDRLAGSQYGLISAAQLRALGIAQGRARELRSSGYLVPVRYGVYRLCGSPTSWRTRATAALLAAGSGAVLSHRSAGILWELLSHQDHQPFEVTRATRSGLRDVIVHRHRLEPSEQTEYLGIPVTTPARTLLDLAYSTDAQKLGVLCDEAMRRRLVTLSELRGMLDGHAGSGRRRLTPMRQVLLDREPTYDPGANRWEQKMDQMWDRMELPPAVRQYPIRVARRLYIPDRAIVGLKIAVDWNGYEYHGSRSRFDYDSDRRADLAAAGWYPLDFTTRSTPESICRTVLAVVAERRQLLGLSA